MLPLAFVLATIFPFVSSSAVDVVFEEVALECVSIFPNKITLTVFEAIFVLAVVLRAIGPLLSALATLFVILPISLVGRTVCMFVDAEPIGHRVLPLTLVDVAVRVNKATLALGMVLLEPPLINGSVFVSLTAFALSDFGANNPLPLIFDKFAF